MYVMVWSLPPTFPVYYYTFRLRIYPTTTSVYGLRSPGIGPGAGVTHLLSLRVVLGDLQQ